MNFSTVIFFSYFFITHQKSFEALNPAIESFFNKVIGRSSGLELSKHFIRHYKELRKKMGPRFFGNGSIGLKFIGL